MIIALVPRVPVDLYSATGIAVGKRLHVQNLSGTRVRVATSEAGLGNDYNVIDGSNTWANSATDAGAWIICAIGHCDINVREY